MKIAILTIGTRGDMQPYVALAEGLQSEGHEVILGGPDNFADWVEGHGIPFHPLGIDMEAFLQKPDVRAALSGKWLRLAKLWREEAVPMLENLLKSTWEAARNADIIVYHPKAAAATDVAEATGAIPICASPIPLYPTGDFPVPITRRSFGRRINRLSYRMFEFSRVAYRKWIDPWRIETLGIGKGPKLLPLGGFKGGLTPRLCAVSPSVLPRPADWDEDTHMTGYWFLDEPNDWQPDAALATFLDAGEPPIYVGFGSMTTEDPERITREVVEGIRQAGVRAILATGWGGLEAIDVPETVHIIDKAPHDKLFPLVTAVVHHGGAGSTAAGLRAGRPTLICPTLLDQPFWGHRLATLGCGPEPQSLRRLKARPFADSLHELITTATYRTRAESIATAIAKENGVARAVKIITAAARC